MSLNKSMCTFFERQCLGIQQFFHWLNPHWFLQPEVMETYLPGTGTLGWGTCWGAGTSLSRGIPPKFFIHHTCVWDQPIPHLCISTPPTSLDACGFFNSIVVGLPLNSVCDGSVWWLFYSLVVIWCGCVKRQAIFTYTSLLTRSPEFTF